MEGTASNKSLGSGAIFLILLTLAAGVFSYDIFQDEPRHCFQCLRLECPAEEMSSFSNLNATTKYNAVYDFTVKQLRKIYHIGRNKNVKPCPDDIRDITEWDTMMALDPPCHSDGPHSCTAGKLQIKSYFGDNDFPLISHATIMGCVKEKLLKTIRNVTTVVKAYYASSENGSEPFMDTQVATYHRMLLLDLVECSQDTDYCIDKNESLVNIFRDMDSIGHGKLRQARGTHMFEKGIGIVILVLIVLLASPALVLTIKNLVEACCKCCRSKGSYSQSMSKDNGDKMSNSTTSSSIPIDSTV